MSPINSKPTSPSGAITQSKYVSAHQRVSSDSLFGDGSWNMGSLVSTPGIKGSQKCWDFSAIQGYPGGFALALAEFAYARLYISSLEGRRAVEWLTVYNELVAANRFVNFCAAKGIPSLAEVSARIFNEYLASMQHDVSSGRLTKDRVRYLTRVVYRVWDYRDRITETLVTLPFGRLENEHFEASSGPSENATPTIPEDIFRAITSISLEYVLTHSTTIIDAWNELKSLWQKALSSPSLSTRQQRRRFDKAARLYIGTTSAPWLQDGWESPSDVYTELHQLRSAATIVLLAFSGIRVSELLSLQSGCVVIDRREDSTIVHYINTTIHKHRANGAKDTWVVVEEVVSAIKVLELLTHDIRLRFGNSSLFPSAGNHSFSVTAEIPDERGVLTTEAINYQIDVFMQRCESKLGISVPQFVDAAGIKKSWSFNTRQFRRTLARHIARQPFGIIAGMLQYKHVASSVFEGYAGAEPEWNKILKDEQHLASLDILEEVAIDLSSGQLAGNLGDDLKTRFSLDFKGRAEDFPPSQIAKWLANSTKSLFVGKFNFCFFDSTKALCTAKTSATPMLNHCQPDNCSNACISKRHIPQWQAQLDQAKEFAVHPKTSKLAKEAMNSEIEKLRSVINSYGKCNE